MFTNPLTELERANVKAKCINFHEEMLLWSDNLPKADPRAGTLHALIVAFQADPDSKYHGQDFDSRRNMHRYLVRLDKTEGHLKLADIGARDFKRMYESARWPDGKKEERGKVWYGYALMAVVRGIFSFGLIYEFDVECVRLKRILSEMKFENGKARTETMTLRQCEDFIAKAHEMGLPSIALSQAGQFDFRARQRDMIGIWVPETEPGISVIDHYLGRKWLRGVRHEEISSTLKLNHAVSKSRRFGKSLERDLALYPMFMAEYNRIPPEKRKGPLVVCESTGRPWKAQHFREKWRSIATAAKIPPEVWNMDSRASGLTETVEATGGNLEAARKEAGHSDIKQTAKYSRRTNEAVNNAAVLVANFRAKNRT